MRVKMGKILNLNLILEGYKISDHLKILSKYAAILSKSLFFANGCSILFKYFLDIFMTYGKMVNKSTPHVE
jgi:hypothetical protein